MSPDKPRYPHAVALGIASKLSEEFAPACERTGESRAMNSEADVFSFVGLPGNEPHRRL